MNLENGRDRTTLEGCDAKQLAELVGISGLVNSSLDPAVIRRRAIEASCRIVGSENASLLLAEPSGELYFEVATGEGSERLKRQRVGAGRGIAGWVLRHKTPLIVDDAQSDERFDAGFDKLTGTVTRTLLAVPVYARGETVGVLEAMNKVGGSAFTESDAELLEALADQVGIAVDNARMYAQLRRRLIENWVIALACVLVTALVVVLLT